MRAESCQPAGADPPVIQVAIGTGSVISSDRLSTLSGQKTIIMVAHRLTTVRDCDTIVVLERGRIVGMGTYDELDTHNIQFRRISQAGNS